MNASEAAQLKKGAARLSVISNTMLVLTKLVVGVATGAISIVSEAAHSAVDLMAALIAFYAVKKSNLPPDQDHAYGHGKYENVSAMAEALLIIGAALWIVYEAVHKFSSVESPEHLGYGIAVMLLSILVNYYVTRKLLKVAKLTESAALAADAMHLRADIWTSVGVLVGLVLIRVTGLNVLDPLIALFVAIIVFRAGFKMTKESFSELTDVCLPESEELVIQKIIRAHPEVITFHRLRTRRSGSYRLIDVHIILNKNMHLDKAHGICDLLEQEIKQALGRCDVIIHTEPCDYHDELGACPLLPPESSKNK
ncbi:cation diffusion facilitator family transporter [Sporomusaceae bacterium BoRhaA]|uniref:cation diffusion facilitator family transporter n=1 Tax=Pelorhabdus rhamnosifermentans TaxID=2772457 RepID=UPI001C064141|nr:cation diffusion facilitator family transporter [Pelorhabdus rhamnosifermentans]MBU2700654.1 cation diffusion facilitator family transporter [Pelorhabdus rhamnosifermentans]